MNMYVGNLPYSLDEAKLRALFEEFGEVSSAKIIKDKFTTKSKGFGFVDMPNDDEANKALSSLNGKDIDGRALRVNEARPQEPRTNRY